MKRAYVGIRSEPHYRRDAFVSGLKRLGYDVRMGPPQSIDADTVYVAWNRYGEWHDYCNRVERAGGQVLIAENGYIAPGGLSPHSMQNRDPYALARSYHNDSTCMPNGGPERWAALGVDLQRWRAEGSGHVLVCPNRSFGIPGRMMPPDWPQKVVRQLQALTKREVRLRMHPGNTPPKKPLVDDLVGCHAAVIWSSSAGVWALLAGVPVLCMAPYWIAMSAAGRELDLVESPLMPDRLPAMQRLAWGQFSLAEIEHGYAFEVLLQPEAVTA